MTAAAIPDQPTEERRASLQDWLAVFAGTIGAMMATLDISIVNASLPTIQGEVGASSAEATWVATSFLVAEVIIIPLSAWLTRLVGLRNLLLTAASFFTLFSVICGLSADLTTLIIGRTGQGLAGGLLIPTAFTIIATRLPPSQQAIGTAAFGATAILGPIMGPILGGWLTETWSWHYAFYINVPICALLLTLIATAFPSDKKGDAQLADADWFGIAGLVIGLGCMTVVLEEGHRELWFESKFIVGLTILSVVGFVSLAIGQRYANQPVLKLSLIRDRAFGSVFLISLVFGVVLYSVIYLIPQFLALITGYNALQAGQVLVLSGIPMLLLMPFIPWLFRTVDVRIAVVVGLSMLCLSALLDTELTADTVGGAFTASQILRGLAQALLFLYLNQAAISAVSELDAPDAASLFNVSRNLGGSIGLAAMATLQEQRIGFHQLRISEAISANNPVTQEWLARMSKQFDLGTGEGLERAYAVLHAQISEQAFVMAYNDLFLALGFVVALTIPLALILRPLRQGSGMMH
ncbi:DHA2 family efflux MFS transporter permease subunit [Altererythrobacter sp. RZ02]|uniref:DHA2 family efflux MFS transporter permease subunit n=1 Tax=Pontixanthobacter rizhaonensis TaxID=2730337 RepID=A0A848QKY1_9SPHN|nr:DHA2 family efflux MFS transporter permease subunit [Pontixanthobacter rizhaonensis]NMW31267.1 DHA2 family efflux MFS transporter permease subunit [Pontixanthobacter rizhaonensis]